MSRAQLKHVLLDVDFFDKPTIRALGFKHTQVSVLLFIRWMMLMSRATDGLVTRDALGSVAREVLQGLGNSVATFETVLQYCLDTGMIHEECPGFFTNERVIKDQESCAVKRQSSNDRQKKFREKKGVNSDALLTRLPDTDTDTVIDTDLNNYELAMPGFDTAQIRHLVDELAKKFKNDGRGRVLQQQTVDSWQSQYALRIGDFIEDAQNTLSKTKAANLIPLDRSKPQAKLSTRDFLKQEMEKENAKSRSA